MKSIIVKNDDIEVKLSKGFIEAIKNLLREEILMMREVYSDSKECWIIGVANIENLSSSDGIIRLFGGKEEERWLKNKGQIMVEVPL